MDFSEYAAIQAQVHAGASRRLPAPPDASWLIAALVLGLDGR